MNSLFVFGLTLIIVQNFHSAKSNQNVIMKTKQEIRGGNSNSFNRNVGQSFVINVNKMGSGARNYDEEEQQDQGLLPPALLPPPQQLLPPQLQPPQPQAPPVAAQPEPQPPIEASTESPLEHDLRLVQEAERAIAEATRTSPPPPETSIAPVTDRTPDGSSDIERDALLVQEANRAIEEAERIAAQRAQTTAPVPECKPTQPPQPPVPNGESAIERDILLVQEANRRIEEALKAAPQPACKPPVTEVPQTVAPVQQTAAPTVEPVQTPTQPPIAVPDGSSAIEHDLLLVQEANRQIEEAKRNCKPAESAPVPVPAPAPALTCAPTPAPAPAQTQAEPQAQPAIEPLQPVPAPVILPVHLDQSAPITGILTPEVEVSRAESLLDRLTI